LTTKIDLSRPPYFDNFKANNHFHRVEYRAGVPVQVQELTGSQTILQDQIEKFGRHIFTDGSVVEKCELSFSTNLQYIKILDTYANGSTFTIDNFIGSYVESSNGIRAHIVDASAGALPAAPDLNTLYINYLTTANDNVTRFFDTDQVLTLKTSSNSIIGQLTTANTINTGNTKFRGFSVSTNVTDGTIFSQGFFVGVEPQSLIISKYSGFPDGISVGFDLIETLVTPEADPSLLDNAAGSPNYAAPGAHRLKLTPVLKVQNTNFSNTTNSFFPLVNFVEGYPTIINTDPNYATLGAQLARRTDEESGNYVISPFNMRTLTRYLANGSVDTQNVRLEVDPGLAYIHGYRVETVGKLVNKLRKGTDIRYLESQVTTITMGNFVYCTEFAGHWSITTGATVSLRSATAQAISTVSSIGNSIDALAAPGAEIGTAKLLAVEFDSDAGATPTGKFRVYLFDVVMNSGQSFENIKSLYTITAGQKGFGDCVLENGAAVLYDNTLKRLIYPLTNDAASAVKNLKSSANTVVTQFDFRTSSNIAFSNTGVGILSVPSSGVGGVNKFTYGIGVLDSVSERDFIVVANSLINTANLAGRVQTTGTSVTFTVGQVNNFVTGASLNVGDCITVGNTIDFATRRITAVTPTTLTISTPFSNTYTNSAYWQTYVQGQVIPVSTQGGQTITISGTPANTATFALNKVFTAPFYGTIYYNVRRTAAVPASKKLLTSVFVKIDCTSNVIGPYCLGFPDIFAVKNIWKGSTYANTNPEVKSSFNFDSGQTDMYYGLAKITPKSPLLSADRLLVELAVFKPDVSSGVGFFSVESYPVDDTGVTANTIFTQYIPTYKSKSDGKVFSYRNSIDFRLYATNTAAYATTAAAASINPANTLTLNTSAAYIPALDASFETDLQYYLGRQDRIGMDTKGALLIIEGTPSESPVPAPSVVNGIDLALASISPYPSLTMDDVRVSGSYASVITFNYMKNRRYTMHDIGSIDQRLQVVEYYTVLNALEQATKNLLIPSTTDLNRFKNGILVDPFNDHSIGDTINPQYNIAIDSDTTEARPIFTQELINLQLANSVPSNSVVVSTNGRLILLKNERVTAPYLFQYFATQLRSPSQDVSYRWAGTLTLRPEGDYHPDVSINPDVVVNLSSHSNYVYTQAQVANSPQLGWSTQWGTWRETSSSTSVSSSGGYSPSGTLSGTAALTIDQYYAQTGIYNPNAISIIENDYIFGGGTTTTTTTSNLQREGQATATTSSSQSYQLGSYVTDVALQPFIRPQQVLFEAHGIKPNQRMWTYFDETPITEYCRQILPNNPTVFPVGGPLVSDASGSLYGSFNIPRGTFRTGERKFRVLDIDNLVTDNTILLSSATSTFFGTNLTYAKNNIGLNTTDTQNYSATITDTTAIVSSSTSPNPTSTIRTYTIVNGVPQVEPVADCNCDCACACACGDGGDGGGGGGSPCAQSWRMPEETFRAQSIGGIYVSAIDIYFERKDPNLGCTVYIREMENGYPSTKIVPFGQKHLTSAEVTVSENASLPTTVVFDAPLFLSTRTEYCVVVRADGYNPNYALWTAALGGSPDVTTGAKTFDNSFLGKFFTSSVDSGWTAYQQEDMKMAIYRLTFTELDSRACFTNDDAEYILYNNYLGAFETGETAYLSNGEFYANNVSVVAGNTTVIIGGGVGVANSTTFEANSKIYITSNTNTVSFTANVQSVVNATAIIINTVPAFTDPDCGIGHLRKNGLLTGRVNAVYQAANTLILNASTSDVNYYLSANTKVIGATSNASANIVSIMDMPYNTVMPKLAVSIPPPTSLTFSLRGTANTTLGYVKDPSDLALNFATEQSFHDRERVVMSRTNEIINLGGDKSLKMYAQFTSGIERSSPAIDTIKLGMLTIYNIVNNESGTSIYDSEKTNFGTGIVKYISKAVILADGQDAEDLRVYVGAYLPAGTSMYVYARLQNIADTDAFTSKAWTPLTTKTTLVSSKTNLQDFIEFQYDLPTVPANPGDNSAWRDSANVNSIVSYTSPTGIIYNSYKAFAVKVVLMSEGSHLVPRLQDVRAIALQI